MRNSNNLRRLQYDPREVREFFFDLRSQPTYPVVHGDPLPLYDLLTVMGIPEPEVYDYLGPRGYLRVAKVRRVDATRLAHILLGDAMEDEDAEGASE
jgi:hypothetical protein